MQIRSKERSARKITIQCSLHCLATHFLVRQVSLRAGTTGPLFLQPGLCSREVTVILLSVRGTRGLYRAQPLHKVPAHRLAHHLATMLLSQEGRFPFGDLLQHLEDERRSQENAYRQVEQARRKRSYPNGRRQARGNKLLSSFHLFQQQSNAALGGGKHLLSFEALSSHVSPELVLPRIIQHEPRVTGIVT